VITYIDTSTLLKLVVEEDGSRQAERIWNGSETVASVSLIEVESRAGLAAARRADRLSAPQHRRTKDVLGLLLDQLLVIDVSGALVAAAAELAEEEGLRGYDAVHLAAALLVGAEVLTSADHALCAAAERRRLHVANPLDG
jgi:predicted nucleic acid-binding protein